MSRSGGPIVTRRVFMQRVAAGVALARVGASRAAAAYPGKPVRIIVPFAAGGAVDQLARAVGQALGSRLDTSFIIDNRPGAGSIIGTEVVAKAVPDGYTLLLAVSTHVTNPYLYAKLPYDSVKDFDPICVLAKPPYALYANADLGLRSLDDLFKYQKRLNATLNYSTGGAGTLAHLGAEEFSALSGLPLQHIIYRGGTPALNDTMAGHVPLFFGTVAIGQAAWKGGKVVALGVMAPERQSAMPDVPTFKEQGWDISVSDWYGLLAPRGVPAEVVDLLNRQLDEIVREPGFKDRVTGITIAKSRPEEMKAMMAAESVRWGAAIKRLGLLASS